MLAGPGTGSGEALLERQQGALKGVQERVGQWAEVESAFGGRWRGLLRSPWGLEGSEVRQKQWTACYVPIYPNRHISLGKSPTL